MRLPRHAEIAAALRTLITSGDYQPGAKLPTEHELAGRHSVGRSTVRAAFAALVAEGLVETRNPAGHFVRVHSQYRYDPAAPPHRFVPDAAADDGHVASEATTVTLVPATAALAERLEVSVGDTLVARTRLHHYDGEPLKTCDSYWRLALVGNSPIMTPGGPEDGFDAVLAELGAAVVRSVDEFHVRMAGLDESTQLGLPAATPVAVHVRTGYDVDGGPVECRVNVLPGDRVIIVTNSQ